MTQSVPITSGIYRTFHDLNEGESFLEFEASTITIPIRAKLPGGEWGEERLKLAAFMRLEVYPAYVNGLGTREFQFTIRDWELFGYSPLLNRVFMGDARGFRARGADPTDGREMAVMTFRVSHHYEKKGDEDDQVLAPIDQLEIDDIVSHDYPDGKIYWQIEPEPDGKGKLQVVFHRKPLDENGDVSQFSSRDDYDDLLAIATGLVPDEPFCAARPPDRNTVLLGGNTTLTSAIRPRNGIQINWRLGRKPRPCRGILHVVSPPRSFCVANQGPGAGSNDDSCDFPARITYAASYDIFVNNTQFVTDQAGVAIADGIDQIPPRDVKVAFEKPHAGNVLGRFLSFGPGSCTGMRTIGERLYRTGRAIARYWRESRLDVQTGKAPPPFEFPRD